MAVRVLTLGLVAALLTACSSGDPDAAPPSTVDSTTSSSTTTSTAPERAPSTTTTTFDPATVEGAVEAAYLRSWDVYADAVYNLELDEPALAAVYTGALLDVRLSEIESRIEDGRAALVRVDHDYRVEMTGTDTALVIDTYRNHQVLIDPETKQPIEADPDSTIIDAFSARLVEDRWLFFDLERLS